MLNETLEETRRKRAKRVRRGALIIGGLLCAAALLFAISRCSFGGAPAVQPADEFAPAAEEMFVADAADGGEEEPDAERAAFKSALREFEGELQPQISAPEFAAWRPGAPQQLAEQKQNAVQLFAEGEYAAAKSALAKTAAEARAQLSARAAALQQQLAAARAALQAGDLPRAELALQKLHNWAPQNAQAEALRAEAAALPALQKAQQAARVARLENRPAEELKQLRALLKLQPQNADARARAAQLQTQLSGAQLARVLKRGLQAVEKRELPAAQQALAEARRMARESAEVALLSQQVQALAKEQRFAAALRSAQQAAARDDWPAAQNAYQNALKLQPGHAAAQEGASRARRITKAAAGIAALLNAPQRLANAEAAAAASALSARAKTLGGFSPKLEAAGARLSALIARYQVEVPVRVISDGQTHVAVRGVGRVGAVREKTIRLKPGQYWFEGAREGYRSKLVQLEIAPPPAGGAAPAPMQVTVICDERI